MEFSSSRFFCMLSIVIESGSGPDLRVGKNGGNIMRNYGRFHAIRFISFALIVACVSLLTVLSGCGSSAPPKPAEGPQRYALTGRVVSVEKDKQQLVVDAADIPGFMMAMTMGYSVKNPSLLDTVSAEDQIKADVVVNDKDVYLENIVVVKKADPAKTPASPATPSTTTPPGKQ